MSGTIIPLDVILEDKSRHGPFWTLDAALEAARQIEGAPGARKVARIQKGAEIILEGDDLRKELG